MKKAFGAIDLLIGLLITAAAFLVCMNTMKGVKIQNTPADTRSIKEHVDTQVSEIEQIRQMSIKEQQKMLTDN